MLLHLLQLLCRNALALSGILLFLLNVKIDGVLVKFDHEAVDMVHLFPSLLVIGGLVEHHVVLARSKSEREILPFLVGLQSVLLTVVLVGPDHYAIRDRVALGIFADTLDRS